MPRKQNPLAVARVLRTARQLDRSADVTPSDPHLLPGASVTAEELSAFLQLAGRVDRDRPSIGDLVELDRALTAHPGLWRVLADLASRAIDLMIDQMNPSVGQRLSLRQGADELVASLSGAAGSPLESALVEQIAVCWVRLRIFEVRLSEATADPDSFTVRFWEERVTAAQRRYLSACESLARIRRLAVRTPQLLQINVAGQQVNIARPGTDQE